MAKNQVLVDVVMAAYNGAGFLDEQIQSVLNQSCRDFRLIVRDDGSTDGTRALLESHAARYRDIIGLVDDDGRHQGSCGSFARLIETARADYVMPCDQDDVWLPEKIAMTLAHMKRLEEAYGHDCPILVHTDLAVADAALRPISSSFWAYEGLDPLHGGRLHRLLLQNVVTGCTLMANRALIEKAMPIPPEAMMHDWWLGLVAAALGKIDYLPQATMHYRQHGTNRVGAHELDTRYAIRRGLAFRRAGGLADQLHDTQRQAQVFLERFGPQLREEQRSAVCAYATLGQSGFLRRRATLIRYGFYKHGWLRNLGLFAAI